MTISQIDRNRLEIIDESVKEIIANLETERDEDRFGGVADLIQSAVSHLIEDLTQRYHDGIKPYLDTTRARPWIWYRACGHSGRQYMLPFHDKEIL